MLPFIIIIIIIIIIKIIMIIISKTIVIIIWNLQMFRHPSLFAIMRSVFCGHLYFAVAGPHQLSSYHIIFHNRLYDR